MSSPIKNLLRKRALRKFASPHLTGITPLEKVKSAVAFIDVEDTSFDDCKEALNTYFKAHQMDGRIFYFDFRKISNDELLITDIQTTILRKDLNWYGKPSSEKLSLMTDFEPDLFISLIAKNDFPIEFMAASSQARFKIGRKQVPGNIFDLIIADPKDRIMSEYEVFTEIKNYLEKIH